MDAPATLLTFTNSQLNPETKIPGVNFSEAYGLGRSLVMYYAIPGRQRLWRKFYSEFVEAGDLCFDIGAHVGNRTATLAAVGARVVAIEPQSHFQTILRLLYGRNAAVVLSDKAVGAKSGKGKLHVSPRTPTVSSLSADWVKKMGESPGFKGVSWDQEERVDITTLDALIAEHGPPKFCKLDVEGYELEALKGLSQAIEHISFEYLPSAIDIALACLDYLESLGNYEFNIVEGEIPTFAFSRWSSASEMSERLKAMPTKQRAGEIYGRLLRADE